MKNSTVDALFQDSFWRELPLCDDLLLRHLQTCCVSSTFFLNFVPIILHDVNDSPVQWLNCVVINYPPGKLTFYISSPKDYLKMTFRFPMWNILVPQSCQVTGTGKLSKVPLFFSISILTIDMNICDHNTSCSDDMYTSSTAQGGGGSFKIGNL